MREPWKATPLVIAVMGLDVVHAEQMTVTVIVCTPAVVDVHAVVVAYVGVVDTVHAPLYAVGETPAMTTVAPAETVGQ